MSARDDVPGADWTSATGFPLLRNLSRGPAAQKPAPGLLARLLARLRPTLPPAPDLAAGDLARPAAVRCASCGTRYFPRPTGSRPAEDGLCRKCSIGAAAHPVIQIATRRRGR